MIFVLSHSTARRLALEAVQSAPEGWVVEVREPYRNAAQNAALHGGLQDIVKAGALWDGERQDLDFWKGLAVSGHAIATKAPGKVTKGWEGEITLIRKSTTRMTKKELSSLLDYLHAWMDGQGIPRGTYA